MKLYISPGACSLASHIALSEAGLKYDLEQVDLKVKKTKSGADYWPINAKGSVPALELDDKQVLTEGAAIMQYVADKKPDSKLAPPAGTADRYRLQEWLNYIASEVHMTIGTLFNAKVPDAWKQVITGELLPARLNFLTKSLQGKQYLMGSQFTVADGYLFTILNWLGFLKMDLNAYPVLKDYMARVGARPGVHAALKAEGLAK